MTSSLSPSAVSALCSVVESEGREFSPSELLSLLALPPSSELSSLDRRLATLERLLLRLSGEAAERLKRERRSLLRLRYGLPLALELPLSLCSADLSSAPLS